ncbi:hypothetical protein BDR05DRAFT_953076 [Suillus weaverae]|nr:hypothetical protein BDR05DRAFT_953076 [Suillus weaverae]
MSSPDLSKEEESPSSGKRPTVGRNEGVAIPTPPAITSQFNPWQYLQSASNGTIANGVLTLERAFKITTPPGRLSHTSTGPISLAQCSPNPIISEFIHRNIPSPDVEVALRAINSIRVSSLNVSVACNTTHTVWNVHIDSPPPNLSLKDYFELWVRYCPLRGTPIHVFGLIQGWFGPAASTSNVSSKASLDNHANHSAPSSKSNTSPQEEATEVEEEVGERKDVAKTSSHFKVPPPI